MYEEIILIIGAFETGLAGEVEKKFEKLGRMLTQEEFEKIFKEFKFKNFKEAFDQLPFAPPKLPSAA